MTGRTDSPDDRLKAALQRVAGGAAARPELREKVAAGLQAALREADAAGESTPTVPPATRWRISPRVAVALAAAAAIAVAVTVYIHNDPNIDRQTPGTTGAGGYVSTNQPMFDAMLKAAAGTPDGPDVFALAADADPADATAKLVARLRRPMPRPILKSAGWTLTRAAVVPVKGVASARFDFTKAGRHVVLMSVAANRLSGVTDGQAYELVSGGQAIAGYVAGPSLDCVIGDAGISLPEVVALRDAVRGL